LRSGEGQGAAGGVERVLEIDAVVEADVDTTILQVDVAVTARLVFADGRDVAEVVVDELGP
jgi:hypothetical protein